MTDQPFDSESDESESPDASAVALEKLLATNRAIGDLEVTKLRQVIEWVVVNEVDPATHELGPLGNRALLTAGVGSPYVPEFDIMEFAAVLGMSTDSGRAYLCRVAELRYRLPKLWNAVVAGRMPVWRSLEVAKDTWVLPEDAAGFVDKHLASVAGSCSWAQIHRLVEEATARFDPERAEAQRQRAADGRRFNIELNGAGVDGVVYIDGALDLADALDLEAAITSVATQLLDLGCDESMDVRRSVAAGEIARAQGALDLGRGGGGGFETVASATSSTNGSPEVEEGDGPEVEEGDGPEVEEGPQGLSRNPWPARSVVLHVHLTDAALAGTENVARCGNTQTPISVAQVRDWCGNPDTKVTVRPVLDLDRHHHVDEYEIPQRFRVQAQRTAGNACVFPFCTRQATSCDIDHAIPWEEGGPTCSCNLSPLCRRHHRSKTHSKWSIVVLDPGRYLWTTPTGIDLIRDQHGTRRLQPAEP